MKKILALAALALATAGPAQAKEVMGLTLCGASDCATVDRDDAGGMLSEGSGPLWSQEGVVPPAKPAKYYRVEVLIGDGREVGARLPFWYVPDQSKLTTVREGSAQPIAWRRAHGAWKRSLDRLSKGIEPYDTPTITRATVNGDPVADPQSYLRLFTVTGESHGYPRDLGKQVILESSPRSPWTDGNDIVYSRSAKAIIRDGELVGISSSLASSIDARASLAPEGRGVPWLLVGLAVGAAVLIAAGLVAARRLSLRRTHPGTA